MCDVSRCRNKEYDLVYLNKKICDRCWFKYADSKEVLLEKLNIPASSNR